MEERTKRKAAQTIQAAQARAKETISVAREECRSQLAEAKQPITNFRNQVPNLEQELVATQEQVDAIEKAKNLAEGRAQRLEQQNTETIARCKALD